MILRAEISVREGFGEYRESKSESQRRKNFLYDLESTIVEQAGLLASQHHVRIREIRVMQGRKEQGT